MCITVYISLQVYFKCTAYKSARVASLKLAVDAQPNTIIFAYTFPFCPLLSIYGPCILYTLNKSFTLLYFDMIKSSAIPVQIWFIDNGGESTFWYWDRTTEHTLVNKDNIFDQHISIRIPRFCLLLIEITFILIILRKKLYGSFALP